MDPETLIVKHEEQIQTLFHNVKELKDGVGQIHELNIQLTRLTGEIQKLAQEVVNNNRLLQSQISDANERIKIIEDASNWKTKTVWSAIVTGIIGAIVGFLMTYILK